MSSYIFNITVSIYMAGSESPINTSAGIISAPYGGERYFSTTDGRTKLAIKNNIVSAFPSVSTISETVSYNRMVILADDGIYIYIPFSIGDSTIIRNYIFSLESGDLIGGFSGTTISEVDLSNPDVEYAISFDVGESSNSITLWIGMGRLTSPLSYIGAAFADAAKYSSIFDPSLAVIQVPDITLSGRGAEYGEYLTYSVITTIGNMGVSSPRYGDSVTGSAVDDGLVTFDVLSTGRHGKIFAAVDSTFSVAQLTFQTSLVGVDLSGNFSLYVDGSSDVPQGPYDPSVPSGPQGGDGTFQLPETQPQLPDLPNGSAENDASNCGLFTRYAMTQSQLKTFGDWLYADNLWDAAWKEALKLVFSTPIDAVINLVSYPFSVTDLVSVSPSNVYLGNGDSGQPSSGRLNSSWARIDWGSINLESYYGNFLDFAPHTKIDLYLPWCVGFVPIDPHEVKPGSISVISNIELSKGLVVHNVFNGKGEMLGSYSGACGSPLPVTAIDTNGKALAFLGTAVAAAATAATAGAAAYGMAAGSTAMAGSTAAASMGNYQLAWSMANTAEAHFATSAEYSQIAPHIGQAAVKGSIASLRAPISIQRNGSFTANGAGMSIQYPFIILSQPEPSIPSNYGHYYGYPSNVYTSLSSIKGYTEIAEIHLNGLPCTEPERAELENLLHGGVIF